MNVEAEYPKRSGAYPYISLSEALERLNEVYEKDGLNYVPMRLLHERWGYNQMSSALKQSVAALGYYGLIDDEGSGSDRKIRVNNVGHKIIKQAPGYTDLIKSAAIKPKVFLELWIKYRETGFPQNDVMRNFLVWELGGFTEKAANHIVNKFKETIEFANLELGDILEEDIKKEQEINVLTRDVAKVDIPPTTKVSIQQQHPHSIGAEMESYNIPLIGKKNATIYIPRPLSMENYELIKSWLDIMKNALVIQQNEGKQGDFNETGDSE